MAITNMTPHEVCVIGETSTKVFPPSGFTIRLKAETKFVKWVEPYDAGIKITCTNYGDPIIVDAAGNESPLRPAIEGDYLIVSQLVKSALPDRPDLLVPAELVRDGSGRIIGCKSLGI